MAIFYMRTSIVRASSGKSAVASAAYQSGELLHSERLGKNFHFSGKEEIVHEEILLPKNAPQKYYDRETLWNAVEEIQNKSNSRFARQFIIAIPNEWTREDAIKYSREFIEKNLVDKGMAVDWAYHEKDGINAEPDNHHLHLLCTIRGFNDDGSWSSMEKKDYALDENGERIPIIDPETGKQKVRIRERNGYHCEEKQWKRITVQSNNWNSKQFLQQLKQDWAEICNEHLSEKIDPRSYKECGNELLPMLHEGSAVREMSKRGIDTDISLENQERKKHNETLLKLQNLISKSHDDIEASVNFLITGGIINEQFKRENINYGTGNRNNCRIPGTNCRAVNVYSGTTTKQKALADNVEQFNILQDQSNKLVKNRKIKH